MARKKELTLETEKTVKKENYIKELAKKLAKEKTALRNLQKEETDKQLNEFATKLMKYWQLDSVKKMDEFFRVAKERIPTTIFSGQNNQDTASKPEQKQSNFGES
ncbi:hypothetical protein LTY36_08100 [Limosilactobacillus agrestis]|uniref:Uncharacterized protein n=1 Tax=Limosilactobacillus agrestis TaxID=2759748 RepID=A0A7W3UIR5_9LACO|nr:hypothetical protein [Limosilactobacillus agrestis]MBB1096307.1 hypothetical protein [Limosilactobacillus agrestis]MCD7131149.1 hypothetical protein [Limosilactobacillus agrestis]